MLPMKLGEGQRSYRLRTTPMRDLEGKLLGAVSVLEDITEMQDIDRFKTRFLSVASKKLRQPLEQLRLSLYTLTSGFAGDLRPLQADVIHGAEEEAERLNDLMSDLIEVSELDTGRRELRMDRFRPIDILRDTLSRARDEVRAKNIDVQIQAFADLSYVNGDRRALRSIMDNLMSNAVRYTPENGTILLQAKEQKDKVQFSVRDSGRGIEAERLPNIFGRFNAAHDQGTGPGPRPGAPPGRIARWPDFRGEPARPRCHLQLHSSRSHHRCHPASHRNRLGSQGIMTDLSTDITLPAPEQASCASTSGPRPE